MEQRADDDRRRRRASRAGRTAGSRAGTAASSSPRAPPTRSAASATSACGAGSRSPRATGTPRGAPAAPGRTSRNSSTMPPAASTAITLRMSRVRRAGKTFTSSSVIADPITAGMTRNGRNTREAHDAGTTSHPRTPGRTRRTSESPAGSPSSSNARSSRAAWPDRACSQSTGPDTRRSRSRARKKLDSAVMMFDSTQDREEADQDQPEQLAGDQRADLLARRGSSAAGGTAPGRRTPRTARRTRARTANRAPRPRSPASIRARAVSHLGASRWNSDGSATGARRGRAAADVRHSAPRSARAPRSRR